MTEKLLTATEKPIAKGMGVFISIWLGSFVSLMGKRLTSFALNIWILQTTDSINFYTLGVLITTLPALFLAPFFGSLVDRWPRRWVMIISEIGSGLCILALALLFIMDSLKLWHLFVLTGLNAAFIEVDTLAFQSAVSLIVPSEELPRASGFTLLGSAIARLLAPVLAGALIVIIQIQGILLIDCASFFMGLIPLLLFRLPEVDIALLEGDKEHISLGAQLNQGWTYLTSQSGLFSLMTLRAVYTFVSTAGILLFVPMLLKLTTPVALGSSMFVVGLGGVVGGVLMGTWANRQEQLMPLVFGCMFFTSLAAIASGLRPSLGLIIAAAFFFLLNFPLITGSIQVIFQRQVSPELQGRIFALSNAFVAIATIAAIVFSSVVDQLLEPMMIFEGPWANGIGQIIGTGPGRGIGLMYIMLGVMTMLITIIAYQHVPLVNIEQETEIYSQPCLALSDLDVTK
ncbi:MFS transporter [Leptolyngbya cf. ectocarpi LEGE 11479]|uniref:MFS transporter n=1 Tax=Leptolyngbya cf. ectocarpi LEGE 11479 TaxID=1828722 RepID=A0A928WY27_LEPEC|nr:MFS transporter [Leptolyngbya ectocarpi]MBE9065565.1 MFS transporter [Leptolyngbya cf. ectocarpi LEGE 11479]